jgi:hypothetical protein
VDELDQQTPGLTGASDLAVQVLQGFSNGRHPGFEIYSLDGRPPLRTLV